MPVISTRATENGGFSTTIRGSGFKRVYVPIKTMTMFDAEAVGICRFVRSATHVLGYSVVDSNYPVLARLVSDMNTYSEELAELQTYADKAVGMIIVPVKVSRMGMKR